MAADNASPPILSLDDFPAFLATQKNLARYNSSAEQRPNHPWYKIDKAQIDGLLKQFRQAVVEPLKGTPHDDRELQYLIKSADKLARVHRSPAIKVALLGAQGAGKSLITNALFDCDGLSLTGADGSACTSSVTRYVDYPRGATSTSRFLAEIKFLKAEKRTELFEEHATSYYQYQNADEDSDDEDAPVLKRTKRESDDLMDIRLKDTALDVFTTLFGSREAFDEEWDAESYRNKEFVRTCKLKCEETLQNEGPDADGVVVKSAQDQQSLINQIRPFLTKVPGVNCLWPLVDCVTINFNNDLLKAGLEFIDLPGWGDINLSRARHVEEINSKVDVVIILTDNIRITSEDKLVSTIRAAIAQHGASKVKIVATKIDAINKNQLAQYTGGIYDEIKQLESMADEQDALLEDEEGLESFQKRDLISKYKSYLARAALQAKIKSRVDSITDDFMAKLKGRNATELPQVFHTSASEYMDWIKPARINFKDQPALPIDMTGIPSIRDYLYTLPADQNLKDYEDHIFDTLPAFVDRIERTVNETDRNGGFICISEDFNKVRKLFMTKLLSDVKAKFQSISDASIGILVPELPAFKEKIGEIVNDWFQLRSPAFNRILKSRGTVPKGLSRARGLEDGVDWNSELAKDLASAFNKWSKEYQRLMKPMLVSLAYAFWALHHKINRVITEAAANLPTVEKAKKKWAPLKDRIRVKLDTLMSEVDKAHSQVFAWATMEHERQSGLISDVTDNVYLEVFNSEPPVRPPGPKATKRTKKYYVMPRLRYQQQKLSELLLTPNDHIVDKVINHFQSEFDKTIRHTIDKHFIGIEALFDDFDTKIRIQGPINYKLRPDGEAIRADVERQIPELQERIAALKALLPARMSREESAEDDHTYSIGNEVDDDFATIYNMMSKRKTNEPPVDSRATKKIKQEPF